MGILKNKLKQLVEFIVNIIVDKLILWPFYWPIILCMKELGQNENHNKNNVSILALNPFRFRGDLEVLAQSGFRVYTLPYNWQTRVFYAYKEKDRNLLNPFLYSTTGTSLYKDRLRLRKYLSHLLALIMKKKNIDCVISAGLFYNQDFDWGAAAENIGYPYIVFHRENLVGSKDRYLDIVKKAEFLKRIGFVGTSIVFHNKIMKSIFDKHSGVDPNKIFSLGSLRMDKFICDVDSDKNSKNNKRVTLFSFPPSNAIALNHFNADFGWYKLHDEVHTSFVELAIEYPEIEFIIKHKGVGWNRTKSLLEKVNAYSLDNLKTFGTSYNAQELILGSDVVTGFCSTALLEAGIADKPIVYPLFAEAKKEEYKDFVCFENAHKMFYVANSKQEYKELIIEKIKNPKISDLCRKYRRSEFEDQVSPLTFNSLESYADLIHDICNNK